MRPRCASTVLELLVAFAIVAVLIAMLIPAISKVRMAADRLRCTNNFRQLIQATHNFTATHGGELLPSVDGALDSPNPKQSYFLAILPFLEINAHRELAQNGAFVSIRPLHCPADVTVSDARSVGAYVASYGVNGRAFSGKPRLASSFPDGTSNTVGLAEHFAFDCNGSQFNPFLYNYNSFHFHRATVNDVNDLLPPPNEGALLFTFQVRPPRKQCVCVLAQTHHAEGMPVAMVDGSVRLLSRNISPAAYWALLSAAGGEVNTGF